MKIGILDLQGYPARDAWEALDCFWSNKQYISITTQTISVWCRQMGHQAYYATYYGWGDPQDCLPCHLDVVFISAHTYLAPLAYALGLAYRQRGVRTVLGGAHARAFPLDSQRFFDLVVIECDRELVKGILAGRFAPGSIISSERPFEDVATIEERLPELRRSTFVKGVPHPGSFIPMLASLGCPYHCDFCVDGRNPYRLLSLERLAADLRFAAEKLPGVKLVFHDPNFGVRFDEVMSVFERVPSPGRNPYGIECALALLRAERIERLQETNCKFVLPSVESWSDEYAGKVGAGRHVEFEVKFNRVTSEFEQLTRQFFYIGTNFIFGIDSDMGDMPFIATKEFIRRVPLVWPVLHIPMPFGATPLQSELLAQGRILKNMPFMFYKIPFLSIILKNYDPVSYYERMADLFEYTASGELFWRRVRGGRHLVVDGVYALVTVTARRRAAAFRRIARQLRDDRSRMAFQMGESEVLPDDLALLYQRRMGRYAELLPVEQMMHPILSNGRI
ncbi:MAG: hypothetical protein JW726_19060 [Anaerolineales bacterium]|nr:hypothetical protein [Anaerolineales bacterium]